MLILEHDAKELLAAHGVRVPQGVLAEISESPPAPPAFDPPWFVKAQVPVGGRGKAGGIVRAAGPAALADALARLGALRIKGYGVTECRIEQAVTAVREAYLGLAIDPPSGQVRVLLSPEGGVGIEAPDRRAALASALCRRDAAAIGAAIEALAAPMAEPARSALRDAGNVLPVAFCELEAILLEINPMLVQADGGWVAGDARVIVDENALVRRPALADLVRRRSGAYPQAALKLEQGFDYVALDPDGDIGLVTTGAGLSMQLIDELIELGCRPFNFCDIRSGSFRGDPARLIWVLRRIAEGRSVRSVLVNIFAGITHLGELARLLVQALEAVPQLGAPLTVRLVGPGLDEAREVLAAAGRGIAVDVDLEDAVRRATAPLKERA